MQRTKSSNSNQNSPITTSPSLLSKLHSQVQSLTSSSTPLNFDNHRSSPNSLLEPSPTFTSTQSHSHYRQKSSQLPVRPTISRSRSSSNSLEPSPIFTSTQSQSQHRQQPAVQFPRTPRPTLIRSRSSSIVLPTPPHSDESSQSISITKIGPPPGLSFSPMSTNSNSDNSMNLSSISSSSRPAAYDGSLVQVFDEDASVLINDSHISDSFLQTHSPQHHKIHSQHIFASSAGPGRRERATFPTVEGDGDVSFNLLGDINSDVSSLLSSPPPTSGSGSERSFGSATSKSPSLSFQLRGDANKPADAPEQQWQHDSAKTRQQVRAVVGTPPPSSATEKVEPGAFVTSSPLSNPLATTNVYINGLPPHFPEQELLDLCKKFGAVISVKTFTRNSDPPSGYGFVLFESLQASEECVKSLRQYRNLHPSFAKRTHRIPGTALEAPLFMPSQASYPPPMPMSTGIGVSGMGVGAATTSPLFDSHESFNSKMERLADSTSSNLYVEGLPANADAHTLDALVAPLRIRSSRIFPSKLSNPPKMIAFVRLESREAALETIDKLNGRAIRGWNGTDGEKLLVKFADSALQRDLRKMERVAREQRDQIRGQSQDGGSLISSPQFAMGMPSAARLSPIPGLGSNVGLGGLSLASSYSSPPAPIPPTPAELERLIEVLRIQSLQTQQQQVQPVPSHTVASLSALISAQQQQQQLQAQAQSSNLYDLQSQALASGLAQNASALAGGHSFYSSPSFTSPHFSSQQFAAGGLDLSMQGYAASLPRHDPVSATDLAHFSAPQKRADNAFSSLPISSNYASSSQSDIQSAHPFMGGRKESYAASSRLPAANNRAGGTTSKHPSVERYVPPPAREAATSSHEYANSHHANS